jgi:hypothetical protein
MEPAASLRFATAVRVLGQATRARGLEVPGFRSPPGVPGAERTVRRRAGGGATVAVRLHGRPFVAVLADMIEGVLVANRLSGTEATRVRTALWGVVADQAQEAA